MFAGLWGLYAYLPGYLTGDAEIDGMQIAMLLPIMLAVGTIAVRTGLRIGSVARALLYAFYLVITFVLAWLVASTANGPT